MIHCLASDTGLFFWFQRRRKPKVMTWNDTKDAWARLSEPPDLKPRDQDMREISSDQPIVLVGGDSHMSYQ